MSPIGEPRPVHLSARRCPPSSCFSEGGGGRGWWPGFFGIACRISALFSFSIARVACSSRVGEFYRLGHSSNKRYVEMCSVEAHTHARSLSRCRSRYVRYTFFPLSSHHQNVFRRQVVFQGMEDGDRRKEIAHSMTTGVLSLQADRRSHVFGAPAKLLACIFTAWHRSKRTGSRSKHYVPPSAGIRSNAGE